MDLYYAPTGNRREIGSCLYVSCREKGGDERKGNMHIQCISHNHECCTHELFKSQNMLSINVIIRVGRLEESTHLRIQSESYKKNLERCLQYNV